MPYLLRMLSPNINPVVVGGSGTSTASVRKASEQALVQRAVQAMAASGVRFDRTKVSSLEEGAGNGPAAYGSQWIYRMEPSLDELGTFETGGKGFGESSGKTRFAVRQVLDQEWRKEEKKRAEAARMARFGGPAVVEKSADDEEAGPSKAVPVTAVKRDFFGRPIKPAIAGSADETRRKIKSQNAEDAEKRVWLTYHEGFSNAVRKPLTLAELMKDL